jgi:flagellar hook-basal body complex protein FliE
MTVEAIAALSSATASMGLSAAPASLQTAAPGNPLFDGLVKSLQDLNTQMTTNQQSIESMAVGQSDELHRVVMNLESTKMTFDLALQVRNKVLDAYQELMRMQI